MTQTIARHALISACLLGALIASGCGESPTAPDRNEPPPPSAATRVLALEGDLAFGDVLMGTSAEKVIRLLNRGTGPMTVTGLVWPNGYSVSWTQGVIQPAQWQDITVRFSPTAMQAYNGTLTVNGDQTSGANTFLVTGRGVREPFRRSGTGNTVFDMPTGVTRLHITGTLPGGCSNFVVWVGGRLVVNEIIGTCSVASGRSYEGTHLTNGGTVVEVTNSTGVSWLIEEVR